MICSVSILYLSGVTNDTIEDDLIKWGVGLLAQPKSGYASRLLRYPFWGADNGAFNNKWVEDEWIDWLAKLPTEKCLFAVAPDVYPDAKASLERGSEFFEIIREMGFPVAVVAQDGAERLDYPWEDFDCLFIGGESWKDRGCRPQREWKESPEAEYLCGLARSQGKWVHMGRVNSLRRLKRARDMGCHSADGTWLKHGPDINTPKLGRSVKWLDTNPQLPIFRKEGTSLLVHKDAEHFLRQWRWSDAVV